MVSLTVHGLAAVGLLRCRPPRDAVSSAPKLELSRLEFSTPQSTTHEARSTMHEARSTMHEARCTPPEPPRLAPPTPDGVLPPPPPFEPTQTEMPQEEIRPFTLPPSHPFTFSPSHPPNPSPPQARIDAPPRPLNAIRPIYPREARERRQEGDVTLLISVSAEGKVESVKIERSFGVECLDRAAVAAAQGACFAPAERDGKPTDSVVRITLSFRVKK